MLERLLPAPIAAVDIVGDAAECSLFPGEEDVVAGAVLRRQYEFGSGRRCARAALALIGYGPVAIRTGAGREPCWPLGVVGSITHCSGYCAAAVARNTDILAIGIDAEPHNLLPEGVIKLVASPSERSQLKHLHDIDAATCWDHVLFSAKESVYKAWYPLLTQRLGFQDIRLSINAAASEFRALIVRPRGTRTELLGRYMVAEGLILTAAILDRAGDP
jgi:4'-phosphopantetheinyl transferase EntD